MGLIPARRRRRDFHRLGGDVVIRLGWDGHRGIARRIFRLGRNLALAVPTPGRFRFTGGVAVNQRVGDCANRRRLWRAFFGFTQLQQRIITIRGRLSAHAHGAGIVIRSVQAHRSGIFQIRSLRRFGFGGAHRAGIFQCGGLGSGILPWCGRLFRRGLFLAACTGDGIQTLQAFGGIFACIEDFSQPVIRSAGFFIRVWIVTVHSWFYAFLTNVLHMVG